MFLFIFFKHVATFLKGHIIQQGCKNMFRAQLPSGTHKCLWPFFTRQHLAWLGVSCQHLPICTSGDFNQRWVGNCTGGAIRWSKVGTVPNSLPWFSADGQWQRCLYLCTHCEWKIGIGHALVCEAELQDMSLHATDSFSPALIRKFLPITLEFLRAGMLRAVSISHPASIPGLFSLCRITGVSRRPALPQAPRGWEIFGRQFIMSRGTAHDTLFSAAEWHWDGLEIPCFPSMYFSVWTHAHYSNTSSPIRPYGSHRSQRERIRCLIFPTRGNHSDRMRSAEFIAVSIWLFHFRKKSSIWSQEKSNLGRESAPMTPSSTACLLWSVSIIWVWSHKGVSLGTVWLSGLHSNDNVIPYGIFILGLLFLFIFGKYFFFA